MRENTLWGIIRFNRALAESICSLVYDALTFQARDATIHILCITKYKKRVPRYD